MTDIYDYTEVSRGLSRKGHRAVSMLFRLIMVTSNINNKISRLVTVLTGLFFVLLCYPIGNASNFFIFNESDFSTMFVDALVASLYM